MKQLQKIIFVFILLIFFTSCEKNEKAIEFNRNVLTEILPIIIDSTCVDIRIFSNPPPKCGKLIFNKEGHYVRTDSTKATLEEIKRLNEWKQQVTDVKKDTSKVIIAFDSKILPYEEEYKKTVVEDFTKDTLLGINEGQTKEYILNFKTIKLNGKFKLKDISEFDRQNIFEKKYKFNFSGILTVSTIKFDKRKENGILQVGFICGRLCGYGNKVYIKKINKKWKIIKMEITWIS